MKKRKIAILMAMAIAATSIVTDGGICASAKKAEEIIENPVVVTQPPTPTATPGAYDKQDIAELYDSGSLKVVSESAIETVVSPGSISVVSEASITTKKVNNTSGKLFTATVAGLKKSTFVFEKEFNFDLAAPNRLLIDGVAEQKNKVTIEFYVDDEKEPFQCITLHNQKRSGKWNLEKNKTVMLENKKIIGKHKISFKVVTDAKKKVSFLLRSVAFLHNDLPMVSFNIDESKGTIENMNGDTEHDTECYGDMSINIPDGYKSEYTGKVVESKTYKLDYIRGRGNSTWLAPKKPYKVKLNKSEDLFGMGSSKHWILLSNYYDVTMLRNKVTYYLGAKLGMEYTPQCVFVDVEMNGQYLGSYYLCEQIRVGKSVVDIDDLEKDEESKAITTGAAVTGGYLLACEPYGDETQMVVETGMGNRFLVESPAMDDYENEAQYDYIANYLEKTEQAIYGEDFKDENGVSYTEYLDIDSAIDYYLMQEFSMNGDGFGSTSTYLYKKRNGKLYWGPLWDFDYVAWGATEYYGNNVDRFTHNSSHWFGRLLQDKTFCEKLKERWPSYRKELLTVATGGGIIDQYAAQMQWSQKNNYVIWQPLSETGRGWRNEAYLSEKPEPITYASEVQRFKNWINERVEWFDANLEELSSGAKTVTFKVGNKTYAVRQVIVERFGGRRVELPDAPKKKGYVFVGWYQKLTMEEGKTYNVPFMADSYVSEDIEVYAKFVKEDKVKKAKKLGISEKNVIMSIDENKSLSVFALPFDAMIGEVTWSSDAPEIVTVNQNGVLTPMASSGSAIITAKTSLGLKATCKVKVVSYNEFENYAYTPNVVDVPKSITMNEGDFKKIAVKTIPEEVMYFNCDYVSGNDKVLEVNPYGYICAKKAGTTFVGVAFYSDEGLQLKMIKVKIKGKKATTFVKNGLKYQVSKSGKTVTVIGQKTKSKTVVIPATVTYNKVTYKVTAIGNKAFKDCKNLKKIVIGKNVTKVGTDAFKNCKKLKKIVKKNKKLKIRK